MNIPTVIDPSLYNLVVPLNLDLRIFSRLGWVFIVSTYSFKGFSLILFDDFSINSLFNSLVSGSQC